MMQRWTAFLTALALLLTPCMPARAEGETVLTDFYKAGEELLLNTDNVTISGEASFSLDGELFRMAKGLYIQEGTDAYQQIDLLGGPENRENGYAVVDFNGKVYAFEHRHGKEYIFLTTNPSQRAVLRGTADQEQLLILGRQTAEQLDLLLSGEIQTARTEDGTQIHLEIPEGNSYPLTDVALNLLWQYGIGHFYMSGYLNWMNQYLTDPEDYITMTRGVVMTTRSLALERLALDLVQDSQGRVASAGGEMALRLTAGDQAVRTLTIQFHVQAENYGTSSVSRSEAVQERMKRASERLSGQEDASEFPAEGGETSPDEGDPWAEATAEPDIEIPQIPDFQSVMTPRTPAEDEDYIAYAREVWAMDYFGMPELDGYQWKVTESEHGYREVWGQNPQDMPSRYLYMEIGPDGWIYSLKNAVSDVEQAVVIPEDSDTDSVAYRLLSHDVTVMLTRFVEALNPGATLKALKNLGGTPENPLDLGRDEERRMGEKLFMTHFSIPNREEETRMKFMVQVIPEVRVVYFNELNTVYEGGNG